MTHYSSQPPNLQYVDFNVPGDRSQMYQKGDRVMVVLGDGLSYAEYKGFPTFAGPPEDVGMGAVAYPDFILRWREGKGREGLKVKDSGDIGGIPVTWVEETVMGESGEIVYRLAVDGSGQPRRLVLTENGAPLADYDFVRFGWPEPDLTQWEYQPPVGSVPVRTPRIHRTPTGGAQFELGNWGGVNVKSLANRGLMVLVTAEGSRPADEIVSAWPEVEAAVKKLGVKTLEIRLDTKDLPKRKWNVIGDGDYVERLDPPVTPYVYYLNKEGILIGGWAGYAPDQKQRLIDRTVKLFDPPED